MPLCLCCGKQTPGEKELLEVRTLHIRDISGEQRIQGLGELVRGSVCDACADKHLRTLLSPGVGLIMRIAAFLVLSLAGGVLFFVFTELPLRVSCAAAVFMGLTGAYSAKVATDKKASATAALTHEQALEFARMELLCASLPQKDEDGATDITYIEFSEELTGADPMLLVERHMLLPLIARQAVERACEHYTEKST